MVHPLYLNSMNKKKRILIKFAVLFLSLIFSIGAIFFSFFLQSYSHVQV